MADKFALTILAGMSAVLWAALRAQPQPAQRPFRWPEGKRVAVSLTFDDARPSQVDVGLPLFDKYGVKVTFYVNPAAVERRLEGWKKAVANGHEIGNHTDTHPCTGNYAFSAQNALEDYTLERIEREMDTAGAKIERLLGVKAVTFAYPCGQKFVGRGTGVQSYVPSAARRFLACRGWLDEGPNDPLRCDLAQLLAMSSDGLTFEQMRNLVENAAARGGWLVFAGHDIGSTGSQTTLVSSLEQFLPYALDPSHGVWLDTLERISRYVLAERQRAQ
jgi:peptidoglycan/xylan/chitin deacetylase (PgdA/CDA1 family)